MKKRIGFICLFSTILILIFVCFFYSKEKIKVFKEQIHLLNISETEQNSSIISSEEALAYFDEITELEETEYFVINTNYIPKQNEKTEYQYALYTSSIKHHDVLEVQLKIISMYDNDKEYVIAAWLEHTPDVLHDITITQYLMEDNSGDNFICIIGGYTICINGPRGKVSKNVALGNGYLEGAEGEYIKAQHIKYVGESIFPIN